MASVQVSINGKSYRLACEDGQEAHLRALAAKIDGHIDSFRGSFGEIGDNRLTVMAALTVADELHEVRARIAALEQAMAAERAAHAAALAEIEGARDTAIEALTATAERVERLTATLAPRGD